MEKLNCKSLMIGDYVMCQSIKDKYARIMEIYLTLDEKPKRMVALNAYGARYCVPIESIEPIPLKRIHLTKNGFKAREETDDTEFYYYDCYEINVSFDEGISEENIPPIIFLTIEFAEKDIAMPIEYVHELQQAMRIMGCDKEIEL